MTDATNPDFQSNAAGDGTEPASRPQRRSRRPMRYQDRIRGIPVPDDDSSDPYSASALAAADDLSDLTAADYATAAETMTQQATESQDGTADADGQPESTEPPGKTFADAFAPPEPESEISGRDARYRVQLREAEADRDRLRGLVESMQRAEIERLASPRLADPRDLWYRSMSVADMLDGDGRVDPAKVDGAVSGLLEQHAHWASPRARYKGELRSGASERPIAPTTPTWKDAFAPSPE